jgi:hypothetical protein
MSKKKIVNNITMLSSSYSLQNISIISNVNYDSDGSSILSL